MSSSRITIPEGFRFRPTEEELMRDYLEMQNQGLDSQIKDIVPVIHVCNHEPRDLPALVFTRAEFLHNECYYSYTQWYFFSPLHYKYRNSTRSNRTTKQGFWKITGKDRAIRARGSKAEIGRKRTLTFYQRRGETKPKKTDWVIHEYYRTAKGNQIGDFVVCCLKNKSDKFDHDKDAPFFDGGQPGSGSSSMASNVEYQITEEAQENPASKDLGNVSDCNDDEAETCSGGYHIVASDLEIQPASNIMITEAAQVLAYEEAVQIPNGNEDAFNNSLQTAGSCLTSDSDMSDEGNPQPGANLGLAFHPFQQQDYDFALPSIDGGPRYFPHINNFIGWDEVIFSPGDINSSLAKFSTIIGGGSGVGSDRNTEVVPESVKGYSALDESP